MGLRLAVVFLAFVHASLTQGKSQVIKETTAITTRSVITDRTHAEIATETLRESKK